MSYSLGKLVLRIVSEASGDPTQVDRLVRGHVSRLGIKNSREKNKLESELKGRVTIDVEREKTRYEEELNKKSSTEKKDAH